MKIATWNVNSVRARKERLVRWLERHRPDVLCLQELKAQTTDFPREEIQALGYDAAAFGQKTYNGVAIIARHELQSVRRGFDDGAPEDEQARLIAATVGGLRVVCAYVPNGAEVGTDKYEYKLRWLSRLSAYLQRHHVPAESLLLCGDFNVAPTDKDVAQPDVWRGSVLCVDAVRDALQTVVDWGLVNLFRQHHDTGGHYSWWDYRMLAFPKNNGLLIDHLFGTEAISRRCRTSYIDRDERKGQQPSDHAPVVIELDD